MNPFIAKYANDLLEETKKKIRSIITEASEKVANFKVDNDLQKLEKKLLQLQTALDNYQPTSGTSHHWIGEVNRVCYDAEDLVEDFKGSSTNSMFKKALQYFIKDEFPERIKELRERVELIISTFDKGSKTAPAPSCKDKLTGKQKFLAPEKLVGRDTEKDNIIRMLLEDGSSVVSIIGMDGLGKTTLAHHVKEDHIIQNKFDHRAWVRVSSNFDFENVFNSILRQRQNGECHKGKSILIVLDDVRELSWTEWKFFRNEFLGSSSSCKVLLTTTNPEVTKVSVATPYYLEFIKDVDCQAIIMDRAFSFSNFSERDRKIVEGVTAAMAEKCKGLPLAADVLGLFLSSDHGADRLTTLSTSDIREFKVYNEEIFPVFRLNNPNLESHLMKCLVYFSLFPYDFTFEKDYLIHLWMAEGFFGTQEKTKLEQTGYDHFDKLLSRSVFQLSKLDDQKIYTMHEFIHKFAEFMASDIYYRMEEEGECLFSLSWYKNVRHLSLLCHKIELKFLQKMEECHSLRTLLFLNEDRTEIAPIPYALFIKLGRLKVLDLSRTNIHELPESLGTIANLKYLDVSQTPVRKLPRSTSNLHQLEILKLRGCSELLELPKSIHCLTSLQQLDVDIEKLRYKPLHIGSLIYLKTLSAFVVGKKDGQCITELKNLKFLRGTICISKLEHVIDEVQAREANISSKHFLKQLKLQWSACSGDQSKATKVLDGLEPNQNLEELHILKYSGSFFPAWLTSPNFNLVRLHLKNCEQADVLPPLGQLPFLEKLHIEGLHRVKYVNLFYGRWEKETFPKLEFLKISNMLCLEKWCDLPDNKNMLRLHELMVEDCPKLLEICSLKHMQSLKKLEMYRCIDFLSLPALPTSLESLIISKCKKVAERCESEKGCDWSIIKSIKYVTIDPEEDIASDFSIT